MKALRVFAAAILAAGIASSSLAQVVPDGASATAIGLSDSGRTRIDISGAGADGISHNTYSAFSVPSQGVDLNNSSVNANLIINEITSAKRSFLNGPLEVQGRQAHVVIANPNGITIDGGSFINTGGVVLSGGRVRFESDAAGRPVISAGNGDILVEGAGLSGTMTTLQMIAARMKIDGPVSNNHASPFASIGLTTGNTEIVLDQHVSPNSTTRDLVKERRTTGGAAPREILIDVTPRGSLSANRVRLSASGEGAGVRFAGRGLSSIGEFSIEADGKVSTRGAFIKADRSVTIKAAEIEVLNAPTRQGSIESVKGAVTLLAGAGNIDITSRVNGATLDSTDPASQGGVTLIAAGDINLLSENADRLAIVFASNGDLVAKAGGSVISHTARLMSNNTVFIEANRLGNHTDMVGASRAGDLEFVHRRGRSLWPSIWLKRSKSALVNARFGQPRIANDVAIIQGASIDINVKHLSNSGTIGALDGTVNINANQIHNYAHWMGTLSIIKTCGLTCRSRGDGDVSLIGGYINATRGVTITADEELLNERGSVIALGNMEIASPHVRGIAGYIPDPVSRPAGLTNAFTGSRHWMATKPNGGSFTSPEGSVTILSANPVKLDGGEIVAGAGKQVPGGIIELYSIGGGAGIHHIGLLNGLFR